MSTQSDTKSFLAPAFTLIAGFLAVGILITFVLPPFQAPDEPVHWSAAIERSERLFERLRGQGPECSPAYSLAEHFEVGRIAFNRAEKFRQSSFDHLRSIAPSCNPAMIGYGGVFTYPGVLLGRLLISDEIAKPARAVRAFYLSRLCQGFLVTLTMCWLLLVARRSGRSAGLLLTLSVCVSPLFIQQSFSVTADTITLIASLTLVACISFWRTLTKLEFFAIILILAASSYTKPTVFPLIPLAFAAGILSELLHGTLHTWKAFWQRECIRISWTIATLTIALAAAIAISVQPHQAASNQVLGRNLSPSAQLDYVLSEPLETVLILSSSMIPKLSYNALSDNLGWLSVGLSKFSSDSFAWLLCIGLLAELMLYFRLYCPHNYSISRIGIKKLLLCAGVLVVLLLGLYLCALLTPAVMYLIWTEVGANSVQGLQGRYFFPYLLIIPALVFSILSPELRSSTQEEPVAFASGSIARAHQILHLLFAVCFIILISQLAVGLHGDLMRRYW